MEKVKEKDEEAKEKEKRGEESRAEVDEKLAELESEIEKAMEEVERIPQPDTSVEKIPSVTERVLPEITTEKEMEKRVAEAVREILPGWIEKPWMYVEPEKQDQLESWLSEWGDFLLDWSRATLQHILNLMHVRTQFPFKNPLCKKSLDTDQLQDIGDYLVNKELAIWWDSERIRLRVYWMSLREWAEEIYQWAYNRGETIVTLFDLVNAKQPWSTLPPSELNKVCEILVRKERARWLNSEKKSLEFKFFGM